MRSSRSPRRRRSRAVVPDADRARPHRPSSRSPSGALVEVLATDPGSVKDFAAWSRTTGNELVEQTADGGVYRFVLRRK